MKDWMTIAAIVIILIAVITLAAVLLWRWLLAIGLITPVNDNGEDKD